MVAGYMGHVPNQPEQIGRCFDHVATTGFARLHRRKTTADDEQLRILATAFHLDLDALNLPEQHHSTNNRTKQSRPGKVLRRRIEAPFRTPPEASRTSNPALTSTDRLERNPNARIYFEDTGLVPGATIHVPRKAANIIGSVRFSYTTSLTLLDIWINDESLHKAV